MSCRRLPRPRRRRPRRREEEEEAEAEEPVPAPKQGADALTASKEDGTEVKVSVTIQTEEAAPPPPALQRSSKRKRGNNEEEEEEEEEEESVAVDKVWMFVKTQGVIRPHGRGVTPLVKQVDVKSAKKKEKARGTVKLARLCGDNLTKGLLIGPCFDQKPFYILTNAAEKVTWDVVTRQVYSKAKDKKGPFQYLRWSLSNTYNHGMNDNDVTDQYRLGYRMMRFQRKTKWCWALFMFF